jgi:crotonobetainyl-CoA:carnitine CoA-transferase CaiB-like acyl-CoA transferase
VRAAAGFTELWVYPGEPGTFSDAITVYPDHVSARIGAMTALALLVRRTRTARGGSVSVAQSEVMLSHLATEIAAGELARRGHTVDGAERDAPWGVFPCAGDDEWAAVTVRGDADWAALCGALDRPDLRDDASLADAAGRDRQRGRVDAAVAAWTSRHAPFDVMERLQAAGVPAGAMLRAIDMPEWAYYRQRRAFRAEPYPRAAEPYVMENTQIHAAGVADPPLVRAPLVGEQTYEIARELLGLGDAEIAELVRRGILEVAPEPHP